MLHDYKTKPSSIQELREFYDQEFQRCIIKDEDRSYHWMAEKLLKPFLSGKKILDVGCGGGFFLKYTSHNAKLHVGLDVSMQALQIASRTSASSSYVQGSGENLPFSSQSFDALVCLGSLEHFLDIPKTLGEFRRLLKDDGRLFLLVPNLFWYKDILSVLKTGDIGYRNQEFEFFTTPAHWEEIITGANLRIEKRWKYNGISKHPVKQWLKDKLIPMNLSYCIIFGCRKLGQVSTTY